MSAYQVIVVADPYVTSLDGLPNIDICLDDIRARKRKLAKTEQATDHNKIIHSSNIEFAEIVNTNT